MKRWIKTILILTLVAALAISTFPAALTAIGLPSFEPNVGWNSGPTSYAPSPVALTGPMVKPCVGWNT